MNKLARGIVVTAFGLVGFLSAGTVIAQFKPALTLDENPLGVPKPLPGPFPKPLPGPKPTPPWDPKPGIPMNPWPKGQEALDALKKAKTSIIGYTELSELASAKDDIGQLKIHDPASAQVAPSADVDVDALQPTAALVPVEAVAEFVRTRTDAFAIEHRYVERLGPFPGLIDKQLKEIEVLKSSVALPKVAGVAYADRWSLIRESIGRLFAPHLYLSKSFYAGSPAPVAHFKCCRAMPGPKILLSVPKSPVIFPSKPTPPPVIECTVKAEFSLDMGSDTHAWCGDSLHQFSTTVPTFDPEWDASLTLMAPAYGAALTNLRPVAEAALARFTASAAAHDAALGSDLARAQNALSAQDGHMALSKTRLEGYRQMLAISVANLVLAKNALKAAQKLSAGLQAAVDKLNQQYEAAVKTAEAASKVAEASEQAASDLKPPVIVVCKGTWRPDCSTNAAAQRAANETQQAYFRSSNSLTLKSTNDRIAAMAKFQPVMTTSTGQIAATIDLAEARASEAGAQREVFAAQLKQDEDQFVLDQYTKLYDAAAERTEAVRSRLSSLAAMRAQIAAKGPDVSGEQE